MGSDKPKKSPKDRQRISADQRKKINAIVSEAETGRSDAEPGSLDELQGSDERVSIPVVHDGR